MLFPGISDSITAVTTTGTCPRCQAEARIKGGECLSCLLSAGISCDGVTDAEEFEAILAEVNIRDADWRVGNYHILEEIGRGGMGVIYRARQRHSKRVVALKRVLAYHSDSRETLERFRREAEAAASLDHPNILPIYEVGEADGLPFFTMKYAAGGTLQQSAAALRSTPRECVRLLAKVTHATAHAHRAGVLHRDLKPGNILLDARGEPMVSDFGLAKWIDATSDLTRSLAIFGTPGFIAPEQAHGDRAALTAAADVYSLGAILFHLLTGRAPFLGEHALAVIRQASDKPAPKLRALDHSLDRDLETICAKCLEREPRARYQSAAQLAEDLERWLHGRAILARPVSIAAKTWKWSRRNPLLASTLAICCAVAAFAVSRQVRTTELQRTITTQQTWQHSVTLESPIDLDSGRPSDVLAQDIGAALRNHLQQLGPATVITPSDRDKGDRPTRTTLSATTRMINGMPRLSLRLTNAEDGSVLLHRVIEGDAARRPAEVMTKFARETYSILSTEDLRRPARSINDPGLQDRETAKLIAATEDLAGRAGGVDLERAEACARRAIALQPSSAAAYGALVRALGYRVAMTGNREAIPEILQSGRKATELAPDNGEAHVVYSVALRLQGRLRAALAETETAMECADPPRKPAIMMAGIWKQLGRPERALAWLALAQKKERTLFDVEGGIADCWSHLDDFARADKAYKHFFSVHPENPQGWIGLCRLRLLDRNFDEARAIYQQQWKSYSDFVYASQMAAHVEFFARNFGEAERMYSELYTHDPSGGGSFHAALSYASALGRLKLEHDRNGATELLSKARDLELALIADRDEDPDTRYRLAGIVASLGETDAAIDRLHDAVSAGWIDYRSLELDPRFDAIRAEPAFAQIVDDLRAKVAAIRSKAQQDFPSM